MTTNDEILSYYQSSDDITMRDVKAKFGGSIGKIHKICSPRPSKGTITSKEGSLIDSVLEHAENFTPHKDIAEDLGIPITRVKSILKSHGSEYGYNVRKGKRVNDPIWNMTNGKTQKMWE